MGKRSSPEIRRWVSTLMHCKGLSALQKGVGVTLAETFAHERFGYCEVTLDGIALVAEVTPRVADRALTALKSEGWLQFGGSTRVCARYQLRFPYGGGFAQPEATSPASERVEKAKMTAPEDNLRQPTREQKRQIIDLLTEVYDTKAERYRGAESDVTVADAIGGGCMFGWVAAIRNELFGPDGKNEELEQVIKAFIEWTEHAEGHMALIDQLADEAVRLKRLLEQDQQKMIELKRRLDVLIKAAGPRAKTLA